MIGATTLAEYRTIERDGALGAALLAGDGRGAAVEETVEILRGLRAAYETHHGVVIDDAALEAAARLRDRYVSEYRLPDKAIDLVDQAAAREAARGSAAAADLRRRGGDARGEGRPRSTPRTTRRGPAQGRARRGRGAAGRAGRHRAVADRRDRDRGVIAARTGIPVG